ncbi:caspase family protein [Olleya namhaensis]|uniref:caspase family protein n=1 Tax=Olleya namhaensis TaxID=1144750 RepID=UPI002490949E|nr:caspase family protein [Olleya namhaensis]
MKNYLFTIGIDNYTHQEKLSTCKKDIIDFKNILLEKYEFEESNVYELLDENGTNRKIQDAFGALSRQLGKDDNLVIFFSGHGDYIENVERGFWIPFDGTKDYTTWIANETIITLIQKLKCRHLLLISDSCFSNSLLNNNLSKSNSEYNNRQSRWALTSAYDSSYSPKDPNSNSLFAETIIDFLENEEQDFRITKLIEFVKDIFLANIMQTPQGSPILVEGHKGGEMVLKINQSLDNRVLKGYNSFLNVLQLYKPNVKFEEVSLFENKTQKIGFQLFKEYDSVSKQLMHYLYLFVGINQTQTLKQLKKDFSIIFEKKSFIIFISKDKDQQNLERRINNIKIKFKPLNIFYIDEFIRDKCNSKLIDDEPSNFLNISNFILPSFYNRNDNTDSSSEFIENWLQKESDPILVIKGTGGIGKTTFAQYAVDKALKKKPKAYILFIDSVQIKDNLLKKNKYKNDIGIYNFYEALFNQDDSADRKLSKEEFRLNVDAGNLIIVIDGLDEVISKITNFDVELFLHSIIESSNELGGGKVIITCRTHFWNNTNYAKDAFDIIELRPFTNEQSIEFFNKSFSQASKRKQALILANEFKFKENEEEDVYHPYVLDIIRSIITNQTDDLNLDLSSFSSKVLNNNIKIDYIIYRVCDRERRRIGQISVDEQILFFIYLATERRGIIKTSNFTQEINEALDKNLDKVNIEAFKSHPLLRTNNTNITFRYDFFTDVFKGLFISKFFSYNEDIPEINNHFIDVISENCWYGSSLNQEISKRIKSWKEDDIIIVSDLVDQVVKSSLKLSKKRAVIANIFNISLLTNNTHKSLNIENNTVLLKSIFGKPNSIIENLCLINVSTEKKIKFDFSNLEIQGAFIDGFTSFYDCTFNDETQFIQCDLLNLDSNKSGKALPKKIFRDCNYDRNLEDAIKDFENQEKSNSDKAKSFITSFLHLFYSNGKLGRQWENKIIKPRFTGIDKYNYGYKKVIRIMKRDELLLTAEEKDGTKFFINNKYKEDAIKYVKDGTMSPIIASLVKKLN